LRDPRGFWLFGVIKGSSWFPSISFKP